MKRGRLFVISAPSGAGKTSLVRALLAEEPSLRLSISHTTRARRPTETEDVEYHFVTPQQFAELIGSGAFLEHAHVFDHLYGTARDSVERWLQQGKDVVLEIDWQGAQQVRRAMPEAVSIFVLPPSRAALAARLAQRGTDAPAVIARRLRDAVDDMAHQSEFDYVVVNDDFDTALKDLRRIVAGQGEALRAGRAALQPLLARLLDPQAP
ncbi:MAG: guanylate kinase [Gammaproteobacteria bacterium]|nr:guanylate kinase [Gammaproteobacteria bacterium]